MAAQRKLLVTTALPYANGPLHLGHMVEHIQADIWARFQKLYGNHCLFISGEDCHGSPIMISAEKKGIKPEEFISQIADEHQQDFNDFNINFDNYYTTHSKENQEFSNYIYNKLKERGDIFTKTINQAFDAEKNMFLPDRYVKGECPRCNCKDQYGDNCENCGAAYSPLELKNPISILSGTTPIEKESVHYFFNLENYHDMLLKWTKAGRLQEEVLNKLNEWLHTGLIAWDISRDAPYFGFEIPDAPGKYFYVWLDAPVGYLASFKNLADRRADIDFDEYWNKDSKVELYHFIGKDIIYFHGLFWPAMLHGSDLRTPTAIYTHGFLTVNGQKMSKSRGTFIKARTYLNHLEADYVRYYFAAKLSSRIDDIDLSFNDFMTRVNSDVVGKVVNIASRCAGFINKKFQGQLDSQLVNPELYQKLANTNETIAKLYESRDFNRVVREIMDLADSVNQYIDEQKPWVLAKQEEALPKVQAICSMGLNCFRLLILYLKPIMPTLAEKSEAFLNIQPLTWADSKKPLLNHTINPFKPILKRIEQEQIDAILQEAKEELPK